MFYKHGDKMVCRFCEWSCVTNATRMTRHVESNRCKIPEAVRKEYFRGKLPRMDESATVQAAAAVPPPAPAAAAPASGTSGKQLRQHLIKLTPSTIEIVKRDIGMLIYTGCLPFSVVENRHLFNAFTHLGVPDVLPTIKEVAGWILDTIYAQAVDRRAALMEEAESIVISVDTTTKITKTTALNAVALLPQPVLLASEEVREKKNVSFYRLKYTEFIQEAGSKVIGLINDGEAVMLAALRELKADFPSVVGLRCFSHLVNLFVKEDLACVSKMQELTSTVRKMSCTVAASTIISGIFKTKMETVSGSVFPSIPGEAQATLRLRRRSPERDISV